MDPARKRKIRLVIALSCAVLLATALVYVSFSASTEAVEPSDLVNVNPGGTYDLTGTVVDGSLTGEGSKISFEVQDRDGEVAIPVKYVGQVPDPFREGREVILTGSPQADGTFVAQKDSLITKCPSKFQDEADADPEHVIIEKG